EYDRHVARCLLQCPDHRAADAQQQVGRLPDQLGRVTPVTASVARAPAIVDLQVAAELPPALLQRALKGRDLGATLGIVGGLVHSHADAPHPLALLRARRKRQSHGRAEKRDERAPVHSITSSARASSVLGTIRSSALAVFKLISNSYLVGACTGRSAGF